MRITEIAAGGRPLDSAKMVSSAIARAASAEDRKAITGATCASRPRSS
jgi:hypothetical protein